MKKNKFPKELIVLTAYFNPFGFRTRRVNYELFRASMREAGVNLLTIEVAFRDAPFELEAGVDVIRHRSSSIMWQRERVLNAAIEGLDPCYSKVAWVNCDVLYEDEEWGGKLAKLLDQYPVVQAFEKAIELQLDGDGSLQIAGERESSIASLRKGTLAKSRAGHAWAARREVISEVGLFDQLIVGGGQYAWLFALLLNKGSKFLWAKAALELSLFAKMSLPLADNYMKWATTIAERSGGNIGFLPANIRLLWHGEFIGLETRADMYGALDPQLHLEIDSSGCWNWSARAPIALQSRTKELLMMREEDG